jgi:hypothetical protein
MVHSIYVERRGRIENADRFDGDARDANHRSHCHLAGRVMKGNPTSARLPDGFVNVIIPPFRL